MSLVDESAARVRRVTEALATATQRLELVVVGTPEDTPPRAPPSCGGPRAPAPPAPTSDEPLQRAVRRVDVGDKLAPLPRGCFVVETSAVLTDGRFEVRSAGGRVLATSAYLVDALDKAVALYGRTRP